MKAVAMTAVGGPEVLQVLDLSEPVAGDHEVQVEITAIGVNFMDIGVRQGLTWLDTPLPRTLGAEGVGRITALGNHVTELHVGQRVAWAYAPGSYAEQITLPAASVVPVPDDIDDHTAASLMMQGLTASHFATDFYPVQPGDVALVHAAAGGLGQLLTQIIKLRGGTVIGKVSSEAKAATARAAGADHVIVDADGSFSDQILALTQGEGVHVVYDGSGPSTFAESLASLRYSGTLCWFGPVLGKPEKIDIMSLPRSIKIGFGSFSDHIHTTELLRARTARLFDWVREDKLRVAPATLFPLADAALAHKAITSRTTTGKLLLIP